MEKIDLFKILVRFLAIKPLNLDDFDLEQAKLVIKSERENSIVFTGDHEYFEDALEAMSKRISGNKTSLGIIYIHLKGRGCTDRLKKILLEMLMSASVKKIIIIGNADNWQLIDPKIEFVKNEYIFEDNHQRFFIYQSPSYSISPVARKNKDNQIEAAITNASDAVSLLSQKIGLNIYKNT